MDVPCDSCSGGFTEIHTDIDAFGFVDVLQNSFRADGKLHHFSQCFRMGFGERWDVLIRRDHEMAVGVGVEVEDDKVSLRAMNDQHRFVIIRRWLRAEDARIRGSSSGDVTVSPGAPKSFHLQECR